MCFLFVSKCKYIFKSFLVISFLYTNTHFSSFISLPLITASFWRKFTLAQQFTSDLLCTPWHHTDSSFCQCYAMLWFLQRVTLCLWAVFFLDACYCLRSSCTHVSYNDCPICITVSCLSTNTDVPTWRLSDLQSLGMIVLSHTKQLTFSLMLFVIHITVYG